MKKRALIAMSGGVDSSVAAFLSLENGHDCTGAMMKLYTNEDIGDPDSGYSAADADDARAVAHRLNMPFYVFDFTDSFNEKVIRPFICSYQAGMTPNPCIVCNRNLKFGCFLQRARELGHDFIVTGHYARIEYDNGRYLLKKGVDTPKDQSYVLYTMTQEQLSKTLFPIGELQKSQVREIAREQGFVNAGKSESQDICFVRDSDYAGFIEGYTGIKSEKGRFMDTQGNDLGGHKGIIHYTIGQRRGLGLVVPEPVYVCSINPENNTVIVGASDELYSKTLIAKDINLIPFDRLNTPMRVRAKIRYRQPEQPATVRQIDSDTLHVEFDNPQRAITKGQAVVLYSDDVVIGGGTIIK